MSIEQVSDGSTAYLTVTFLDKDGTAALPTSVSFTVRDQQSNTVLRADTVTPGTSVEIVLTPDDNTIQNAVNLRERRRVTVVAEYGSAADQCTAEFDYEVRNLIGYPLESVTP